MRIKNHARVSEDCRDLAGGWVAGTPEAVVGMIVDYCTENNIGIVGIGDRCHHSGSLGVLVARFLVPAFGRAGYQQLLTEMLFTDAEGEMSTVQQLLSEHADCSTEESAALLGEAISNQPSRFPVLHMMHQITLVPDNPLRPDSWLMFLVASSSWRIRLYGMIDSETLTGGNDEDYVDRALGRGGLARARSLRTNGKLLIVAGDMHVCCKQMDWVARQHSRSWEDIAFGGRLYAEGGYLHLSVLAGAEAAMPSMVGFDDLGWPWYAGHFRRMQPGTAMARLIDDEWDLKATLLYKT